MSAVETVWYGRSPAARAARALLAPASWLFAAAAGRRNARYDVAARVLQPALPALSVGNVTVGGTGKTPVAAWAAARLRELGAHPAIVLRGYGGDEPLVHERLNPGVPVVADGDRVRGVLAAKRQGADCAILDDAFQHRRIARVADWVLVSAEQWRGDLSVLPAGPLREPLRGLRRATLLLVTRKSATREEADRVGAELARIAPRVPVAIVHLAPLGLVGALDGVERPLAEVAGRRVVAVAAVGSPDAFFAQLRAEGADVVPVSFADHHAFSPSDVGSIAHSAREMAGVVCTLKDAVKLAPLWPRAGPPLWYVSQHVVVERGRSEVDESLHQVLARRS